MRLMNSSWDFFVPDGGREVGQLVDDDEQERDPVRGDDLAAALGVEPVVAAIHLGLQIREDGQALVDGVADEHVGDLAPHAELDPLAVDQHQAHVGAQGGVPDDVVQQDALAAAGFPGDQEVAVGEFDVDRDAVLVQAEEDRLMDRQRPLRHIPRCRVRVGGVPGPAAGEPLPVDSVSVRHIRRGLRHPGRHHVAAASAYRCWWCCLPAGRRAAFRWRGRDWPRRRRPGRNRGVP